MDKRHPWYRTHRGLNWVFNSVQLPSWVSTALSVLFWCLALLVPWACTLLSFSDPAGQNLGDFRPLIQRIYQHRLAISIWLAGLALVSAVSVLVLKQTRPVHLAKAKTVLDLAVAQHFRETNERKYVYRATLFRIRCFPFFGSWAGIVCRSRETYARSGTIFFIDRKKSQSSTGFVGRCLFAEGQTIMTEAPLPDPKDDRDEYIKEAWLAPIEFDKMNVNSRVFFATGIFCKGKLWGFLMIDTNDPDQAPNPQVRRRHDDLCGIWALALSHLVL